MTNADLDVLLSPTWLSCLEQHLHMNSDDIALQFTHPTIPTTLLATQVKYLQKASKKLPTFYKYRCIIPPRAYEQASSQVTAKMKPFSGNLCLDLTGGLGVDSYSFSQSFERVTTVEADPVLAKVTTENMCKLKAGNVEIMYADACKFLLQDRLPHYDLIYIDPDRRPSGNKRVFRLEDSQPNIKALLPQIFHHTHKCVIKLSPLFDIDEAFQQFDLIYRIHILSVQNECKELLVELDSQYKAPPEIQVQVSRRNIMSSYKFNTEISKGSPSPEPVPTDAAYIYEPDVAFYKGRLTRKLFEQYFPQWDGSLNHPEGFYFSPHHYTNPFPGRIFRILDKLSYQPRKINRWLKAGQHSQVHLLQRYFPHPFRQVQKQIATTPGGTYFLIFTMDAQKQKHVFFTERIDL